jgi:hypothetical protein
MACPCCQEKCQSPRCCECFAALGNRYPRFVNATVSGSCVITDSSLLSYCGGELTYNFSQSITLTRVDTPYAPDCPAFLFSGFQFCVPLPTDCCQVSGIGINASFNFWSTDAYANIGRFRVTIRHPSMCGICVTDTSMIGTAYWPYTGCQNAISQAGSVTLNPVGQYISGSGSASITGFQY